MLWYILLSYNISKELKSHLSTLLAFLNECSLNENETTVCFLLIILSLISALEEIHFYKRGHIAQLYHFAKQTFAMGCHN